jgi:hypothetical protein
MMLEGYDTTTVFSSPQKEKSTLFFRIPRKHQIGKLTGVITVNILCSFTLPKNAFFPSFIMRSVPDICMVAFPKNTVFAVTYRERETPNCCLCQGSDGRASGQRRRRRRRREKKSDGGGRCFGGGGGGGITCGWVDCNACQRRRPNQTLPGMEES